MKQDKAQFRYNGGLGALLCSGCKVILKTGADFTDEEIAAIKGHEPMPPQYCLRCQLINLLQEKNIDWEQSITVRDDVKYRVVRINPPYPVEALEIIQHPDVKSLGYLKLDGETGIDVLFKL